MANQSPPLSLARRLIGRYLMFGLGGIFICLSLVLAVSYQGEFTIHFGLAAGLATGLLFVGALVLHRMLRVSQAIDQQLRQLAASPAILATKLEPLAEADFAAVGWNSILNQLQDQHLTHALEERLSALSEASQDNHWSQVFQALQDGIAVCNDEDVILLSNTSFESLVSGHNGAQAVGQNITTLLENMGSHETSARLAVARDSAAPFVTELRKSDQLADGAWRLSRTSFSGEEGELKLRLWSIRDITQQRLADEMRNQFVFTATHELRTPLANIKAYAETLADADDLDIGEQKKFFNVINSEATRLARFVDELLNLSQMESGAVNIQRSEVDVERLLQEVVENMQPQVHSKRQNFEYQFPAKLKKMRLDKDKMVAALVNLLGNAVKYTPEEGDVQFTVEADEKQLQFHVVDTGIGIAAHELPRLGEKFFRSQDARVSDIVGSGLGLAFAQEVARLHGGKIAIHSELDKGSRFSLILPLS